MESIRRKRMRIALIIVGIATLGCIIFHVVTITMLNGKEYETEGLDTSRDVYADVYYRGDATSSWIKQNTGRQGNVYDATINNTSIHKVRDWTLTIYIQDDCYINQFWNGEVEIHQYVGTDNEVVQRLNLANYEVDDLKVDYTIDESDLLIPLTKGDYIVYYPSKELRETPVNVEQTVKVGGVFYYEDTLDLSDYTLQYYLKWDYATGIGFYISLALMILFGLMLTSHVVAAQVYRRAEYENRLRQSGVSCLSEIYALVYIVDLVDDTVIPVGIKDELDRDRPKDMTAQDQFQNLMNVDSQDAYLELAREFADLTTLQERLKERNSIAFEYESKHLGWQRIQFVVMERGEDNSLEKVLFTVQEINQEKQEKDEILSQVEAAKMESSAKSAFLANMSHEIRTPINTILGLDTMILRECQQGAVKNYARDIKIAGNMLLALVNSVLDYSKLEAGKMELIEAEYSLTQMVYEIESVVKNRIENKNLAFHVDVTETLPNRLYGDDVRLKQIIINLLTNALKYTQEGGIRLGIYGTVVSKEKLHLLVSVRDTGMGITKEDQKKLFDRFARFDEQKNRKVEGTGIGMSLVKGLLEMMDSELKLSSSYGKGSDFYFEIDQKICGEEIVGKVDWTNPKLPNEEEYEVSFIAPDAKVLVVDDNEMNLTVFENLLKETQIQIQKATSGAEALKLAEEKVFDLIFMDHMMPKMDGIETFQRLRQNTDGRNQNTPVIILTANAIQGAKEEYIRLGFTDFLSKPIDDEKLEEQLKRYLPDKYIQEAIKQGQKGMDQGVEQKQTLPEIEGVDSAYALEHTGSLEGVLYIMKQFVQVAKSDAEELRSYKEALCQKEEDENALNSYRIKVHAMKTSAALCGALQVYGAAAQLEYAAKEGAVKQILETTEYFLEFWLKLQERMKKYLEQLYPVETKEGTIPKDTLYSLLDQLVTSMDAYDIKNSDQIIEELDKYQEDEQLQKDMEELRVAVANLDAERCRTLCDKMKGE